jgi:hypothetical protein
MATAATVARRAQRLLLPFSSSRRLIAGSSALPARMQLVDEARYPIGDLTTPAARKLVETCRQRLRENGAVVLPGFLSPPALANMAAEARDGVPLAYFCDNTHNVYLTPDDVVSTLPLQDPRRRRLHTIVGSIAFDCLAANSRLRQLYMWEPLVEFIRSVLDLPRLYRLADPLGALSINVFRPGDLHEWHFDESEYTTTIMLQAADTGGFFEYIPHMRQPDGSEAGRIAAVLDGDETGIVRLPFDAGAMSIFSGRRSLHRVTRIDGNTTRLVAVLTFNSEPGVVNSPEVRRLFWGRTEPHAVV